MWLRLWKLVYYFDKVHIYDDLPRPSVCDAHLCTACSTACKLQGKQSLQCDAKEWTAKGWTYVPCWYYWVAQPLIGTGWQTNAQGNISAIAEQYCVGCLGWRGGGGGCGCVTDHLDGHGIRSSAPVALVGLGALLLLQVRHADTMCVAVVTKPVVSRPYVPHRTNP